MELGIAEKAWMSLRLSCKYTGFTFSDYYITWIHQLPGNRVEWVGLIRNKANSHIREYAASVKGRFIISRDDSKCTAYLPMHSLRAEYMVAHYCKGDIVRGTHCEPRPNLPAGGAVAIRGR